jgi:hypothetical protein
MRWLYSIPLAIVLWTYMRALSRCRDNDLPLSPLLGWLAGLGVFVIVPLTFLVVVGEYTIPARYSANDLYSTVDLSNPSYGIPMAVVLCAVWLTCLSVIYFHPRTEIGHETDCQPDGAVLKRTIYITLCLSMLGYAYTIYSAGGLASFLVTHWYVRDSDALEKYGDLFVAYMRIAQANQLLFTAAAAVFMAHSVARRKINWWLTAIIGLALLVQMIMSGNRIFIALFGVAFCTLCWLNGRKRLVLLLLVLSPVPLIGFSVWASVRSNLTKAGENAVTNITEEVDDRVSTTVMDATQGSCVVILLHMINDFGGRIDYLGGVTYTKVVTFVVPRSLYPDKPESFAVMLADWYEPGEATSLGATQLGELYANFGPASILLLPLLTIGIMAATRHYRIGLRKHYLLSGTLFLLFVWMQLAAFEDCVIMFVFVVLLYGVLRLPRFFRSPNAGHPRFSNESPI